MKKIARLDVKKCLAETSEEIPNTLVKSRKIILENEGGHFIL